MESRKLMYQHLPRQGEAVGVCSLVHPFRYFWDETRARFIRQTLDKIVQRPDMPNLDDMLIDFGFGPGAFSLEEWFQHYRAQPPKMGWDSASIRKIADTAEDLARDDGLWKESAADLNNAKDDALTEFRRRLDQIRLDIGERFGPGAVPQLLTAVRQRFDQEVKGWKRPQPWTSRMTQDFNQIAHTVRSYARPRSFIGKLVLRFRPGVLATWWLSDSQRRNHERKLFPQIVKAMQIRFEQERDLRKRYVADSLLGTSSSTGLIDEVLAEAMKPQKYFGALATAIKVPELEQSNDSQTLYTADNLDAVIDSATNRTLADIYESAISGFGCTPADFAACLNLDGVEVNGRVHKPIEWLRLSPMAVLDAVRKKADLYLGSHDLDAPLNISNPRTAFESAATITLTHPHIRNLVKNLLPTMVQRSEPFAETGSVASGEPQIHSLLYCHPRDRRWLERDLQTSVTLANASSSHPASPDGRAYQIRHPYIATLVRFAVAVPLGALKSLASWVRQSNLLRKRGMEPLHDLFGTPEVRRLPDRPTGYDDSRQLFGAARIAGLFTPLGSAVPIHYALATVDSRLESLFAPVTYTPEWKTDKYFHSALQKAGFVCAFEVAFPNIPGLGPTLTKLAREIRADVVSGTMTQLGILEAAATGHHFRVRWNGQPAVLPRELFAVQRGNIIGLSEDECIAAIHRNDDLYNTVFWGVCDALDFDRVSPNDVPEFLLNQWKSF